jgi:hypothetical protein
VVNNWSRQKKSFTFHFQARYAEGFSISRIIFPFNIQHCRFQIHYYSCFMLYFCLQFMIKKGKREIMLTRNECLSCKCRYVTCKRNTTRVCVKFLLLDLSFIITFSTSCDASICLQCLRGLNAKHQKFKCKM